MGSVVRRALVALLSVLSLLVFTAAAQALVVPGAPGDTCPTAINGDNLPPSCFEAHDGNVLPDNSSLFDWQQLVGQPGFNFIDDNNPADTIFTSGSKEQDQSTWSLTQSSPPAKDDINHVAVFSDAVPTITGTHDFFYAAFDRASANGDVNLDVEFNQNRGSGPIPPRTLGDILITFDGNSSSNFLRLGACIFYDGSVSGNNAGPGWYPIGEDLANPNGNDLLKGSDTCPEIDPLSQPAGLGAINAGTLDASLIHDGAASFGSNLAANEFGELAIDLNGALTLENNPPPCVPFGDAFIHTRPSEAVANELKDYVSPINLKAGGDCSFTVEKKVGVNGGTKQDTTPGSPVFANAGDTLNYDLVVTNTGSVALTPNVTDAQCSNMTGPDGDTNSNGKLDAGEVWTYHCSHATYQSADNNGTDSTFAACPEGAGTADQYVNLVSVSVSELPDVTHNDCAYGELNGQLKVVKSVVDPSNSSASDRFDLSIDQTVQASAVGDGGTTGFVSVSPGPHSVSEAGNGGTDLTNYDSAVSCDNNASGSGTSLSNIAVGPGQQVTCTITNTRKTAQIRVAKTVVDPSNSSGSDTFDLSIDGHLALNEAQNGSTSSYVYVPISSTHSVSEAAGSVGNLANYDTAISCDNAAQSSGAGTSLSGIGLAQDSQVTCTFTNTRKTANLIVKKVVVDLSNSSGADRFALSIDDNVVVPQAANGDQSDPVTVPISSTHSVSEANGNQGTDLANYDSSVSCDNGQNSDGNATSLSGITLTQDSTVTCTITNTRKTAQIRVKKIVVDPSGASAGDRFGLSIDDNVVVPQAQNGSTSDYMTVPISSTHSVSEAAGNATTDLSNYASSIACDNEAGSSAQSTSLSDIPLLQNEQVTCTITNQRRAIAVKKSGPDTAFNGDTLTFTYQVTNPGGAPLHDVTVTDDKCSPVTLSSKNGDSTPDTLDPGDTWTFTCSMPAPTTKKGDPAMVNTATATGTDSQGNTVTAQDQHTTRFLHPAVAIDKSGPATANAGDLITYTLVITNPGDVGFPATQTIVTDDLCQAPPALQSKNGDATPDSFDPGDSWTYTCQVQTQPGQNSVHNTGTVTGTVQGHSATANDDATTTLANQGVSPVRIGSAKLRGSQGCIARNQARASVSGALIASVTFYVDGRKVKTLHKPTSGSTYTLTVNGKKLRYGAHKVKAVVTFQSGVTPAKKTLSLTFTRCRPATPKFTG
jgi:uncharacterized repeat protein (TIGR01451 family)